MEQKSKSIGNTVYLVTQMDAIRSLKVQTKLIKILGHGAVQLLDRDKPIKDKLAALIPKLMEKFDADLVNELVLSLFDKGVFTQAEGVPKVLDFSTHFAGKPFEMWKVVAFIMEVNFDLGELSGSSLPTTGKESLTKDN